MFTNLCFCLTILLIPLFVELFNLQTTLRLSAFGHSLAEVLIVCCIYWLILQIVRLDNLLYLRHLIQHK